MFKLSIRKTKYQLKGQDTYCTLYFNIKNLWQYLCKGPNGICVLDKKSGKQYSKFDYKDFRKNFIRDNSPIVRDMKIYMCEAIERYILTKLEQRGLLVQKSPGDLYQVTGVAKYNPTDTFDKIKGRRIAYDVAELKLIIIEQAIQQELKLISLQLIDCANWMTWENNPKNINDKRDNILRNIESLVE